MKWITDGTIREPTHGEWFASSVGHILRQGGDGMAEGARLILTLPDESDIPVPRAEIEALKEYTRHERGVGNITCTIAPSRLDRIIARLPKPDHVACLQRYRDHGISIDPRSDTPGSREFNAALEAAIEALRKSQ